MTLRPTAWLIVAGSALMFLGPKAVPSDGPTKQTTPAPTVDEARQRARLLHETVHDTLQIVHAQYFEDNAGQILPAASLKNVFQAVEENNGVKLRWLVVEGRAMNIDHNPKDDFEKEAAKALTSGQGEYERFANGVYRYAGPITLRAECLKCHMPNRSSNKERTAGLLITMPVGKPS